MFIADVLAGVIFGDFRISPTEQSKGDFVFMLITMSLILYFESLIAKNFKGIRKNKPVSGALWLSSFAIPLSSIFIAVIVLNSTNTNQITITIFVILIFAINLLTFYLHDSLSSAYADKLRFQLYEQEKNYYYNQCELMAETIEETKSYRHDIKNHLSTANNFIKSSNYKEASEYMSKLIGEVDNNTVYSDTGNIAFDSIINYKLRNVNDSYINVQIKVVLPSNLNIDVVDVITIMGNLLDNAVNATIQTEQKNISLTLYYDKGRVFIKIENTFNGDIKLKDNEIVSLSANPEHGYGLKNVKKSVDKYNGLLDISYTDTLFTVDVLLYIKQNILK
jgi:sensor histidine kinase regulating citrate/malate metabolism